MRDELMGLTPKDYDVATSATPAEVRQLFGFRRTLAVGAAFGVITLLGPRDAGQIDVATFRTDGGYSDGRHPDAVTFSTPEHDAQRRDFTINGLFYDPIEQQVIDYVGGQQDLQRRVIRAIRDPAQRIEEDKLRMLRAVRFAARFGFEIEAYTLAAIAQRADQLSVVSAERIAAEMEKILLHASRSQGLALLRQTGLLPIVLPELQSGDHLERLSHLLSKLESPSLATAIATIFASQPSTCSPKEAAANIGQRWKLSNHTTDGMRWILESLPLVRSASTIAWPLLQRILIHPRIDELLALLQAMELKDAGETPQTDFCREKLALPLEQLNPPPLLSGNDLHRAGLRPGPRFRELLDEIRDQQLLGNLRSLSDAIEYAVAHTTKPDAPSSTS